MAELAAATSDLVMVDPWEAAQPGWQRTLAVMRRVGAELSGQVNAPEAGSRSSGDGSRVCRAGI